VSLWDVQGALGLPPDFHISEGDDEGFAICGQRWAGLSIGVSCAHPRLREYVNCLDCLIIAGQRYEQDGWEPIPFGPYGLPCVFCGKYGDEETLELLSGDEQGCFDCVANWLDKLKREGKP